MSKVLFLNIAAHGHINPTLGLVEEFVKHGSEVVYFCTDEFKEKIEKTGAIFKSYGKDAKCFSRNKKGNKKADSIEGFIEYVSDILDSSEKVIAHILEEIKGIKFDYIVHSSMFAFGSMISQILNVPTISSFAIFATKEELKPKNSDIDRRALLANHPIMDKYREKAIALKETFGVETPELIDLFFNKGDLNIAYTSKYFVSDNANYDENFIFIGPPIYDRKENLDFPFEKLKDRKVIYISLGTIFRTDNYKLYNIFFEAFRDVDVTVVMSAYNADTSDFSIPDNFIVRDYVPQTEVLKYTDVSITHGGMNSTNDLLFNNIPFVAIPIRADQPYMASRASELGACITLDKDNLTPEMLRNSVERVLEDPTYLDNIKKINKSFNEAGGYKKAYEEIIKLEKKVLV